MHIADALVAAGICAAGIGGALATDRAVRFIDRHLRRPR